MLTEIQARHQKQLAVMRGYLDGRGFYQAATALEFVRGLECGTRKDGATPKFHHQLSVARYVRTIDPNLIDPEAAITAAFLHDVLEDHGDQYNRAYIANRFGSEMATIVWRLSKKTCGLVKDYPSYFGELAEDATASVVKLVDRAHNLQTMQGVFSLEKQAAYAGEVYQWFFPMIREARRTFPQQYGAYENVKINLRCQVGLLEVLLASHGYEISHGD